MRTSVLRYLSTALIALVIGFAFLLGQYWFYAPPYTPPAPKITYAVYQFVWGDYAVTARTSECGITDGVYYFNAIDDPIGYAYFSIQNLRYGLCLETEMPESPMRLQ